MYRIGLVQRIVSALVAAVFFLALGAPYAVHAQEKTVEVEAAPSSNDTPARSSRQATRVVKDSTSIKENNSNDSAETEIESTEALQSEENEENGDHSKTNDSSERPKQAEALPTGEAKSAVTPQKISLPKAEGSIEGMGESFTPNLSAGTGTFSVPIALPPGRAGVQPSLALTYSTSGGNGPIGFGWSLPVPFIARQTDRGLPRYQVLANSWRPEDDRFIYNGGQELVPIDSDQAAAIDGGAIPAELDDWQQYRARVEGAFMRFFRSPDGTRWVVQDKNGMRFDFGILPSSEGPTDIVSASFDSVQSEFDGGYGRIFQWNLTRMSDAHGSSVYYQYFSDQGQRYLRYIYYVSPNSCAVRDPEKQRSCGAAMSEYGRRVHLVYEDRPDDFDSYITTWRVVNAKRLERIEITAFEPQVGERTLVRRYHLKYDPISFYSLLKEVQVEGRQDSVDGRTQTDVYDAASRAVSESSLGSTIVGRLLPPMRFTYSQPLFTTTSTVWGFGGLDGHVHDSPRSPPHSVDEARSDLFDVNSDGLPDLIVTDPARYRTSRGEPAVGVFFNGFTGANARVGQPGGFADAVPMAVPSGYSSTLDLSNFNIVPMDIDGDGRSDMLHMPRVAQYDYFTPTRDADRAIPEVSPRYHGWKWSRIPVSLPKGSTDPRIDFGKDSDFIKMMDVNNDHLIDVVRTTGTVMQTWLNLGWVPGGDGLFGQASYNGSLWEIFSEPIESCLLYETAGAPVDFNDKEVKLADINGDGIQDIVKLRRGRVLYWPGRGPGLWGVGDANCDRGEGANRYVEMESPPQELSVELDGVYLSDINQDGADDILQVRYDEIDVWLNKAGQGFTERMIIDNTPYSPAYNDRIRLADIDGSGTTDIIYGNADKWQWIDPMGGIKPRLLTGVENGLGGLTTLEYGSSVDDYLRDLDEAESCKTSSCERFTWSRATGECEDRITGDCAFRSGGSPVVSTVVRALETTDQFSQIGAGGQPGFVKRTEYQYHDGYYEGIEHEFRGFGAADAIEIGGPGHPTSITRTHLYQGRRPNAIASDRLADNPDEALKGRTYLTEVFDENGRYLSTTHATFTVRKLLTGIDRLASNLSGTAVSYAFVSRTDEVRYDVADFVSAPAGSRLSSGTNGSSDFPAIVREEANGSTAAKVGTESDTIPLRGLGYAHLVTTVDQVDNVGHVLQQTARGRVRGEFGETPDEAIVTHTTPVLIDPGQDGQWLWRTASSYISGQNDGGVPLNLTNNSYDATGNLLSATQVVQYPSGTPSFNFSGDSEGAQGFTQVAENVIASTAYDSWGNAVASCSGHDMGAQGMDTDGCLRYGEVSYDDDHAQFPVQESVAVNKSGGIFNFLNTNATWDQGLGVLQSVTDPNDLTTLITYDGLGRLTSITPPNVAGCRGSVPLTRIDYEVLADGLPVSVIHTVTEQSCARIGRDQLQAKAYVDGLGRTRATLLQAEGSSDNPNSFRWQRGGITTFHNRGTVNRVYQPDMIYRDSSAPPLATALALPADIPFTYTEYDPFGRPIKEHAEDDTFIRTFYRALSTDVWDQLDQDPGSAHHATFATERKDGHGRVIDQVLRNRQYNRDEIEYYRLLTDYRADNKVVRLTRAETESATHREAATIVDNHSVQRIFFYDSVGRRIGSFDPDTDNRTESDGKRSWRYLFNRVGDLAAVRDPRGCGQNFYYDYAGRLIAEDYVQCGEAQVRSEIPIASLPNSAVAMDEISGSAGQPVDVRYYFDAYPEWFEAGEGFASLPAGSSGVLGRATGVIDRGQRSVNGYDDRGNVIWSARQMAVIPEADEVASTVSGNPPAVDANDGATSGYVLYDTAHTYERTASFDHAARPQGMTLPRDPDFDPNDANAAPYIGGTLTYNARNLPNSVSLRVGPYRNPHDNPAFPIVSNIEYERDGLVRRTEYGDDNNGERVATESESFYDIRRRPVQMVTLREPTVASNDLTRPLNAVSVPFDQQLTWDAVSNLVEVSDQRPGNQWPKGYKPQSYRVVHDSLYRVVDVEMDYTQDDGSRTDLDAFVDYRQGMAQVEQVDPMRTKPAPMVPSEPEGRVVSLTYEYDFLANMVEWTDDANQFYERSLGQISNGIDESNGRPSALRLATDLPTTPTLGMGSDLGGYVEVDYGAGGNVVAMTVHGQCNHRGSNTCYDSAGKSIEARRSNLRAVCECAVEQHYQYRWDELNRLNEARRYDRGGSGGWGLVVRQRYRYDAGNQRTVKQTIDSESGDERIAIYVYPGDFERRGMARDDRGDEPKYRASEDAETQYLVGGARVVWKSGAMDISEVTELSRDIRVTVAISDIIQTTSGVIDLVSGSLVEASTYYPNGARESYRASDNEAVEADPEGFTGKEADEEVGLVYFGERYLIPRLGRWASPDPLRVHGEDAEEVLNSYHYIGGNLLQRRDPLGLESDVNQQNITANTYRIVDIAFYTTGDPANSETFEKYANSLVGYTGQAEDSGRAFGVKNINEAIDIIENLGSHFGGEDVQIGNLYLVGHGTSDVSGKPEGAFFFSGRDPTPGDPRNTTDFTGRPDQVLMAPTGDPKEASTEFIDKVADKTPTDRDVEIKIVACYAGNETQSGKSLQRSIQKEFAKKHVTNIRVSAYQGIIRFNYSQTSARVEHTRGQPARPNEGGKGSEGYVHTRNTPAPDITPSYGRSHRESLPNFIRSLGLL